ncbi:Ras-related protein Rab-7L1 [Elysia marginata]|uniref:Ras-related protein Rab-7L1 n=1 Tax=Elysia marginata TaxID=1093978 RepID=A0AAV4ILA2_9GAST|nr:Ras-related protein Rab-7L1 [Elysia marginata]
MPELAMNVDPLIHTIELDSKKIRLQLWDLIFSPRYRLTSKACYKGAKGIVMVYDVTSKESFEGAREWKQEVDDHQGEDTVLMLVGNKCDLETQRQVSTEEGKQMAAELGVLFMETSALEDVNVEDAFVSLIQSIKEIVEARQLPTVKNESGSCILS